MLRPGVLAFGSPRQGVRLAALFMAAVAEIIPGMARTVLMINDPSARRARLGRSEAPGFLPGSALFALRPRYTPSIERTAAPERSLFGMNPRAALVETSDPKSAPSRLEVRITVGGRSSCASCSATSKPSMSGS